MMEGYTAGGEGQQSREPPVQIPKNWGSKARKDTGWLRRNLNSPDNTQDLLDIGPDDPVPSIEDGLGDVTTASFKLSPPSSRESDSASMSTENDREPPMNYPRTWGSKARKDKGWLRRNLNSPDPSDKFLDSKKNGDIIKDKMPAANDGGGTLKPSPSNIPRPRTAHGTAPNDNQTGSPHRRRSSETSPLTENIRPTSTSQSNGWRNTSLDRITQWEETVEQDMTFGDVLSSTPVLKIKNRNPMLDQIREREDEIERLSQKGVTTTRLTTLRESTSREQLRRQDTVVGHDSDKNGGEPDRERYNQRERARSSPESQRREETRATPQPQGAPDVEDNGEPIPNTPIVVFRNSQARKTDHKPDHDSHNLLKQLARVTSDSPSPSRHDEQKASSSLRDSKGAAKDNTDKPISRIADSRSDRRRDTSSSRSASNVGDNLDGTKPSTASLQTNLQPGSATSKIPISTRRSQRSLKSTGGGVDSKRSSGTDFDTKAAEERIVSEQRLFELSDRPDSAAGDSSSNSSDFGQPTPRPRRRANLLSSSHSIQPTPVVTGAWIDTPGTQRPDLTRRRSLSALDDDALRGASASPTLLHGKGTESLLSRPRRRKAARTPRKPTVPTAADDLARLRRESGLEDSTLDSLDAAILAGTGSEGSGGSSGESDAELEFETDTQRARRLKLQAFTRMDRSLKHNLLSIRDARRGIERLQGQVDSVSAAPDEKVEGDTKRLLLDSLPALPPGTVLVASPEGVWEVRAANAAKWSIGSDMFMRIALPGTMPIPRLFTFPAVGVGTRKRRWRLPQLTRLGVFIVVVLLYWTIEFSMCSYMCKPLFEYGDTPRTWKWDGPRFPYVIPTVAGRALGFKLGKDYQGVVLGSGRWGTGLEGWFSGAGNDAWWGGDADKMWRARERARKIRNGEPVGWGWGWIFGDVEGAETMGRDAVSTKGRDGDGKNIDWAAIVAEEIEMEIKVAKAAGVKMPQKAGSWARWWHSDGDDHHHGGVTVKEENSDVTGRGEGSMFDDEVVG